MIDPAFDPVMPERVRDGVRELFASWGDGDVRARVNSMLAYLHRTDRDPEIGGWLAGMLVFVDVHQRLITALEYYPEVIPFALDAVIAGIGANVKGPRRLWLLVERLVVRTSRRPPGLVPALVTACGDNYDVTHAAAVRIAEIVGEPARDALAAAREGAPKGTQKRIDNALAVLAPTAPSHHELALGRVLAAWRATRDPALEPAIELLGRAIARARGPLPLTREVERDWLAVAGRRDLGDTTRLLESEWPRSSDVIHRLVALGPLGPDPRFAELLVLARSFRWPPPIHAATAQLVAASATAAMLPALAELRRDAGEIAAAYDVVEHAIAELRVGSSADVADAHAVAEPLAKLRTLAEQHAANPADPALRTVYADALVEAGDPRGEFIALAGTTSEAGAKRARKLLARHADAWTAPLPNVVPASRRFAHGFLAELATHATHEQLHASAHHLEWATLERLYTMASSDLWPLVRHMPVLGVLTVHTEAALDALARHAVPSIRGLGSFGVWLPPSRDTFPALAVVAARCENAAPIVRARELGLHAIVVVTMPRFVMSAESAESAFVTVCRARDRGPPVMRLASQLHRPSLEWWVEVTGDRAVAAWAGDDYHDGVGSLLSYIADGLARSGVRHLSLHTTVNTDTLERHVAALTAPIVVDLDGHDVDLFDSPGFSRAGIEGIQNRPGT